MMRRDRGFTLVELMVVVGLIAILAAIVVPVFFKESQTANADGEVLQVFTELRLREEQFKVENGVFLSTSADETATHPAAPSNPAAALAPLPAAWAQLRVMPPVAEVRCAYVAVAGAANDATNVGVVAAAAPFSFVPPVASPWFYLLAECDMDADGASNSFYFTSSVDSRLQKLRPGK